MNKFYLENTQAQKDCLLAISAMYYLGKELVTPEMVVKIKERLSEQEFEQLRQANLVSWMKKALNVEQKYV